MSSPTTIDSATAQATALVEPFMEAVANNISTITHTLNHDFNWTLLYVYIPMLSVQLWIIIGLLGRMIKHLTGQELSLSTMVCELERIDILIAKSARKIERRGHHLPTDVEKGVSKGLKDNPTATAAAAAAAAATNPPSSKERLLATDAGAGERKGSGPKNPLLPLSPLHSEEKELPTTRKRSLSSSCASITTTASTTSSSSIPTPEDLVSADPFPYRHHHHHHHHLHHHHQQQQQHSHDPTSATPTPTPTPHRRRDARPTIGAQLLPALGNGNPLSQDPSQNLSKQANRHTPNWEVYAPSPPLPSAAYLPSSPSVGPPDTPSSSLRVSHFLLPPSLASRRFAAAASGATVPMRANAFAHPSPRT